MGISNRMGIRHRPLKGIIYTVDAIIAVAAFIAMLGMTFFFLSNAGTSSWDALSINEHMSDSIAVLDLSGALGRLVDTGSAAELSSYLNDFLPARVCANITVLDSSGAALYNIAKAGCTQAYESSMAYRAFAHNSNAYYSRISGWYK